MTDDTAAHDSANVERVNELIEQLSASDRSRRQDARTALVEMADAAVERLLLAQGDPRGDLETRRRIGNVLGDIGDPRLDDPEHLGPFVEVPGGPFLMGSSTGEPEADTNALPQHEADVATFEIARYAVTNMAFALFVEDGGYHNEAFWLEEGWSWRDRQGVEAPHYWKNAASRPNHPVVGVGWYEGIAYGRWLTERLTGRGELKPAEIVRLPTEAEWEKAARGGTTLDTRRARPNPMANRRYPWGDAFFSTVCNTAESGLGGTAPIGMFSDGVSPYGVEGLGGNVMEWCSSRPVAYPYNAQDGRELLGGNVRTYRVSRGGAWPFQGHSARCAYRHWNHPDFRGGMVGLRMVRGRSVF
jgi:formylglycine-generating enzyme required for sulfatase activity